MRFYFKMFEKAYKIWIVFSIEDNETGIHPVITGISLNIDSVYMTTWFATGFIQSDLMVIL